MSDFIWGGSAPANATSSNLTEQASLPTWYQEYLRGSINKASSVAATPYTQYTSPRLAGFSAPTTQAQALTQSNVGNWQPGMQQAQNTAQTSSQYNLPTFQNNWMNPNMAAVYDDAARRSNINFNEKIMPGVMNTFTGGGQFGSSRNMDFANRAIRDQQDTLMGQMGTMGQAAWDAGQRDYSNWANTGVNAANSMGNLATATQVGGLKDAAALDTSGRQIQQQQQSNYDLAYQDFQNQQNYPKDQAAWLASIIQGYPAPGSAQASVPTNLQPIQGQSPLASLASGVLSGVAATQPQVAKKAGGLVTMKCGGVVKRRR